MLSDSVTAWLAERLEAVREHGLLGMEAGTCALSPRRFATFEAHRAEAKGLAFWMGFFLLSFLLL